MRGLPIIGTGDAKVSQMTRVPPATDAKTEVQIVAKTGARIVLALIETTARTTDAVITTTTGYLATEMTEGNQDATTES